MEAAPVGGDNPLHITTDTKELKMKPLMLTKEECTALIGLVILAYHEGDESSRLYARLLLKLGNLDPKHPSYWADWVKKDASAPRPKGRWLISG